MRYICTRCKSTSVDGNLWCQEVDCPAGTLPLILQYGDMLGSIKIVKLLCVLRTAAIYAAERDGAPLLLKVANPGKDNEDALHREADALYTLTHSRLHHPAIPTWIPHGAVDPARRYGMVEFRGQERHYTALKWVDGDLLTAALLDNPQLWHVHVGWFMLTLAGAIIRIHQGPKALHLNLTPDAILVVRNNLGVPQPLLLDLGLLRPIGETLNAKEVDRLRAFTQPAYTAPELITGGTLSYATDVHDLGVLLYEMLEGKPAFPQALRKSEEVTRAIAAPANDPQYPRPAVARADLPMQPIAEARWKAPHLQGDQIAPLRDIVSYAIARNPAERYQSVDHFRQAIYALYGDVKDKRRLDWRRGVQNIGVGVAVVAAALMVLAILIPLVVALTTG